MVREVVSAAIRSSEKKITANTGPAHIGEHDRQALEHQRRAGVRGNAKAEEGWENHKASQHGNQSIGNRGNYGRLNQIFVFIQIAG